MLAKFCIKDFLQDRELRNCSPKTVEVYEATLNEFEKFIFEKEIFNVNEITASVVKEYLYYSKTVSDCYKLTCLRLLGKTV